MIGIDHSFWSGKSVLVTGHTGFKGGWLSTWLTELGAAVHGYALPPTTIPSYFALCDLKRKMNCLMGDIRDLAFLTSSMQSAWPEIVIHLAAQPLVRQSYLEPVATFETNVMGTANLLEAIRRTPSVRAAVIVTSDKCYYPDGAPSGHREHDRLGGIDPYSSSKACAELVAAAYTGSFFERTEHPIGVATVRAGNVIGGGDWAKDRIVPDAVRALARSKPLVVRNPNAIRPWQHVMEPLAGYLMLAERLFEDGQKWAGGWNFGPSGSSAITVGRLADLVVEHWGTGSWRRSEECNGPPETTALRLNSTKALCELGWASRLTIEETIDLTIDWYRHAYRHAVDADGGDMYAFSAQQIHRYELTKEQGWVSVMERD
jgi:CDP-glucose 4,6-dehydratase